jgi:hypothetical protein
VTVIDPLLTERCTTNVAGQNVTERALTINAFESAVQPQGRFGAVFERDDETAYFYLLDLHRPEGRRIIGAYWLAAVVSMPPNTGARVTWTPEGDMAGLVIEGWLIAVFDLASAPADKSEGREPRPDERERFLDG